MVTKLMKEINTKILTRLQEIIGKDLHSIGNENQG